MKKNVAIVTLYGNSNFGNKLQNYAIQTVCEQMGFNVKTVKCYNSSYKKFPKLLNRIKYCLKKIIIHKMYRNNNFRIFEKKYLKNTNNIYFSNEDNSCLNKKFDFFIIGSDQVWNPFFGLKGNLTFLDFTNNKFSYSASFGINSIDNTIKEKYINGLNSLKYISVRENQGLLIVKELTNRDDIEVLVDPTMLLSSDDWNKLSKKPFKLESIIGKKYILCYFLGKLSEERKKTIKNVAIENGCNIINLMDKNDPFYSCGPSEFLYLEKNAFLVCTDSFHSCVFAFIFNKPFVIFDRDDKTKNMNSRLETLVDNLKLKDRLYNGITITKENICHDYSESYIILEKEKKKSIDFIKKALLVENSYDKK